MQRHTMKLMLALALLTACAEQPPSAPLRPAAGPTAARTATSLGASAVWSNTITGETSSGALYALHMPHTWNGGVIYYAHGIKLPQAPIELPTGDGFPAVRDSLGRLGFAVAYSSFSENGWAVRDGTARTRQLEPIFISNFGRATHSYLVGTSMGGLIAQKIAEQESQHYDGILAMCAPLGGATTEVTYIGHVRVLFDFFYPGVLPGTVLDVPPGLDPYTDVIVPVQTAITINPNGLGAMARMKQTPLAGVNGPELAGSLINALVYDVVGIDDFLRRTKGESMFDNANVAYDAAAPGLLTASLLTAVNAGVGRFTATRRGETFLDTYYDPNGDLEIPTVTLHTTRDPLVPFFHEAEFATRVAGQGRSGMLLQRTVVGYGHCAFSTGQMIDAFTALDGWVKAGVKPAN